MQTKRQKRENAIKLYEQAIERHQRYVGKPHARKDDVELAVKKIEALKALIDHTTAKLYL